MQRSFKDRLAALEALEQETEQGSDDTALATVAHLGDDAVVDEVFAGLRSSNLHYYKLEVWPMDKKNTYWRGIALRASNLFVERQVWVCPLTEEEATIACRALRSGAWLMQIRATTLPDVWYDPTPPAPFFTGCWETAEYHTLKRIAKALGEWAHFWWYPSDAPPMPATTAEVIAWVEWGCSLREAGQL